MNTKRLTNQPLDESVADQKTANNGRGNDKALEPILRLEHCKDIGRSTQYKSSPICTFRSEEHCLDRHDGQQYLKNPADKGCANKRQNPRIPDEGAGNISPRIRAKQAHLSLRLLWLRVSFSFRDILSNRLTHNNSLRLTSLCSKGIYLLLHLVRDTSLNHDRLSTAGRHSICLRAATNSLVARLIKSEISTSSCRASETRSFFSPASTRALIISVLLPLIWWDTFSPVCGHCQ